MAMKLIAIIAFINAIANSNSVTLMYYDNYNGNCSKNYINYNGNCSNNNNSYFFHRTKTFNINNPPVFLFISNFHLQCPHLMEDTNIPAFKQ